MPFTGVFPVYNLIFKIGINGLTSSDSDLKQIADMENFGVKIDGKVEDWTPMDTAGWARALMTGKAFSISLKGKRHIGDLGNDYVAAAAWKDGLDCTTRAEITFPDGAKLGFNCVIDVTNVGGDDSTKVAPLEFELKGDGKPNYTPGVAPAALTLSISNPANNAVGVALTVKPALTFNNALSSYISIVLLNETDNALVANTMALDVTNKILTITPGANLVTGKTYDIILTGITDIYGQELAQQIIKFTVA